MPTSKRFNIKSAEILCVGTEILIGDIVNTNAAYISAQLALLGIPHYYQAAVGDNPKRLKDAISSALQRSDLLIMSGGLGPTYDDLTKETAAECMGRKLYLDERSLQRIKDIFAFRNRTMTQNNEKQAYIPEGSVIFDNNAGTAPGCAIEDEERGKIIIMLPGPPFEMKRMFAESVVPYLQQFTDVRFVSKNINIFGMGESAVESVLKELMMGAKNPTVAPYCGDGEVRLRVTASGTSDADCEALCDEMIAKIRETEVGNFIYGLDTTLAEAVVKAYREKGKTLAVAESCTGGLIAKRITDVSGSSEMFGYGAVTYANEAKNKLLGVRWETLEAYGAVSEQTAMEMAAGVRALSGADVGIATTGIAGPGGGTDTKPVGLVYMGVASEKGVRALKFNFNGDRDRVRILASGNALSLALNEIKV
ncbi:MAG: competence/damage-inducible protein A [Ruminococcaceae bacterium]|nr:competence/damage-inducible protein A [Oscillospiraceae bacterium]